MRNINTSIKKVHFLTQKPILKHLHTKTFSCLCVVIHGAFDEHKVIIKPTKRISCFL